LSAFFLRGVIQVGGENLPGRKHIFLEGGSVEHPLPFREAFFASRKVLAPDLKIAASPLFSFMVVPKPGMNTNLN
jgi:hypothetical protein